METNNSSIAVEQQINQEPSSFDIFKEEFNNTDYQTSRATYLTMFILFLYSCQGFLGDQTSFLKDLNEGMRLFIYITTIFIQWFIFGIIYFAIYREKTNIRSIGVVNIRAVDFAWGGSLLMTLFATGALIAFLVAQIGYPMSGDIGMLLPEELLGKIIWLFVSFTAGFCEETLFRGYLLTRIRLLGKFKSWTAPVIISSLAFGIPHAYQGVGGLVTITVLGVLFALVYIRTRSLWPCIIAHFFLDFFALFMPQ